MDYKLTIKLYVLAFFLLQKTKNKIVQDEKMSAVDGWSCVYLLILATRVNNALMML